MKKILFIFFAIVLFLLSVSWYNGNPKVIISRLIKDGPIRDGRLVYRVYFLKVFPIGEAIFDVAKAEEYNGQKVYHLSASAENLKIFSKFVRAYATLDSYIDAQQLNPILFKQRLVVRGRKDVYKEVFYDQVKGIMVIGKERRQILPNTQDPLSAIFNLRRIDFEKADNLEVSINTNQKNYILKGAAKTSAVSIRKENYRIALLKASISRHDKNPYHKSHIATVLLKEGGNIPISINVFASGILIDARLIEIR